MVFSDLYVQGDKATLEALLSTERVVAHHGRLKSSNSKKEFMKTIKFVSFAL